MLIKQRTTEEAEVLKAAEEARKEKPKMKKIQKFSWADEDAKVKIYIDFAQFAEGPIQDGQVSVQFTETSCECTIIDAAGVTNLATFNK